MRDVCIVGVGCTPVGEFWEVPLRDLAARAIRAALADAAPYVNGLPVEALYIGNALGGSLSGQGHLGPLLADYAGLPGVLSTTVEAAGASGGAALHAAWTAVAAGAVDVALVLGVEKVTDTVGPERTAALTVGLDYDYEAVQGATPAAMAALLMRLYMNAYDLTLEQFEGFSMNAHANGHHNPHAMFRNLLKPGRFATAPLVAPPVNLFDSAPEADGAAAVILMAADQVHGPADMVNNAAAAPVRIAASAGATDTLALAERADPLWLQAAHLSAGRAFAQAGINPADVDFFELHDSYTVISALSLEACGFAARGTGWQVAANGDLALTGRLPISTFGGLKARGHPFGATGVYQAVEAVAHLRGTGGENQVQGARIGLIQNLGGLAASAFTHVLVAQDKIV